jgi:hypothetical protein
MCSSGSRKRRRRPSPCLLLVPTWLLAPINRVLSDLHGDAARSEQEGPVQDALCDSL